MCPSLRKVGRRHALSLNKYSKPKNKSLIENRHISILQETRVVKNKPIVHNEQVVT